MARDASIPMIEVADAILWSNILRGCYVGRGRHVSRGSRVENKEESFMNKLIALGVLAGAVLFSTLEPRETWRPRPHIAATQTIGPVYCVGNLDHGHRPL